MQKKIAIVSIILVIILGYFIARPQNDRNENYLIGKHAYLLKDNLDYNKMLDYCYDNKLDPDKLVIYEAEYSLNNTGIDFGENSLPIFNPNIIQSILGVYSSVPVIEKIKGNAERYYLYAEPEWYKNQDRGILSDKLIVRYLMSSENIELIDDTLSYERNDAEKLSNENIETANLANELHNNIPVEMQSNLKQLVMTYTQWINNNISYPSDESVENLRRKYVNLSSPDTTIKLGIGVCEDNMHVLREMIKSQGLEAYSVIGIMPDTLTESKLYPNNFNGHGVTLIMTDKIGYLVNPTLQVAYKYEEVELPNGLKILASKKNNYDNTLESFPMFPLYIKEIEQRNSALFTKLEQISVKRIGN